MLKKMSNQQVGKSKRVHKLEKELEDRMIQCRKNMNDIRVEIENIKNKKRLQKIQKTIQSL